MNASCFKFALFCLHLSVVTMKFVPIVNVYFSTNIEIQEISLGFVQIVYRSCGISFVDVLSCLMNMDINVLRHVFIY